MSPARWVAGHAALILAACADERPSSRLDCERSECLSREVASWPMPNSVRLPLPNSPRLVAPEVEGEVHDELTGLVWQQVFSELTDYEGATEFCDQLGQDWRLPTRIELISLVDHTRVPSIDPKFFPDTPQDYFWTSSPLPEVSGSRYSVYFGIGETASGIEQQVGAHARCVRAGMRAYPPQFEIGEATARDRAGGLTWQRRTPDIELTIDAARLYCEELELEGASDFRLPSAKELQTLIASGPAARAPLIDAESFPGTPAGGFWSEGGDRETPWRVDFGTGVATVTDIGDTNYVRCVR